MRDLLFRLRALFGRRRVEADLDDELRFHREQQFDRYRRAGLSPGEARRRVGLEFGGLDQTKEDCRDARGISFVEHAIRDARYALRGLAKMPGFTTVAVLTLALGLGATTAIFSVVYGVLLRPLPFTNPSALVVLNETTPKVGEVSVSYPNFVDWRSQSRAFAAMSFVASIGAHLSGAGAPETVSGEAVSSNYLSMIGVRPAIGRDFSASEDRVGTAPVVLLANGLWQTHFGGAHDVVGRTIDLDGRLATIVGVLPRDVRSIDSVDFVEPIGVWLTNNDSATERGSRGDSVVVGRMAAGTTFDRARAEMDGIATDLARAYPNTNARFGVALSPIRDVLVGDVGSALVVLFAAVVCVLLIACANVANLLLIRGAGRRRELALRIAIGAGRGRIVSQLLVESAVLAAAGGLLGVGLAMGGVRMLAWLIPAETLGGATVSLNGAVLAFAAAAAMIATIVFGLAPAVHQARADTQGELRDGGRTGTAGKRQQRWRGALTIAEVALALVLLVGAGLMTQSVSRLLKVNPGIRTDRVLTLHMDLRTSKYEQSEARRLFWQRLLDDVGRLPGVQAAALGSGVPLTDDHSRSDITIEGMSFAIGTLPHPDVHVITPGYVSTLGIELLRGRVFTAADTAQGQRVGLINKSVADRFFPHADPIGRRFMFGRPDPSEAPRWFTIAGVLADTRTYGLDNPSRLEVYIPLEDSVRDEMTLLVKSAGDPSALVAPIRAIVSSIDPDEPISDVSTMDDLLDASVSTRRITLVLLGLFSALALTLSAIGIYGVISYGVAQRTQELGIRLALGAQRWDLLRLIVGQGVAIAGVGIVIGLAASIGLTRLMSSLLFAISAVDPVTFAAVSAVVALVAVAAAAIPGRRAVRVSPLTALRRAE